MGEPTELRLRSRGECGDAPSETKLGEKENGKDVDANEGVGSEDGSP